MAMRSSFSANFDDEKFAGNFMIRINVANLDAWWARCLACKLVTKYSGFRINRQPIFPGPRS